MILRVFNDRGSTNQGQVSAPGPARAWCMAWACGGASSGPNGTNVNELTHQQLTDMGRAPSFYDCLVEALPPLRSVATDVAEVTDAGA